MSNYRIYAGLGGVFDGAEYQYTEFYSTMDEAERIAYSEAVEIYNNYGGMYGLKSLQEIMEEEGVNESDAEDIYVEYREPWLEYYAVLSEDEEIEEE